MDAVVDGQSTALPLSDVGVGSSVRVTEIRSGTDMVHRCLALGITVGTVLTVRRRRGRGVVVASGGNRVAIGAEVAEQIVTEPAI